MENNNHQQNNYGNGFILGVIVGVLLTLLFTTKRGRVILKEAMEKGMQKFSNLEALINESKVYDDEDDEEGDDFIPSEPVTVQEPPKEKKEPEKPKVVKPDPKPVVKETPTPKPVEEQVVKQTPVQEEVPVQEVEQKTQTPSEKPKPGKRWFRGLRKKN